MAWGQAIWTISITIVRAKYPNIPGVLDIVEITKIPYVLQRSILVNFKDLIGVPLYFIILDFILAFIFVRVIGFLIFDLVGLYLGLKEKFEDRLLEKPIDLVETAPKIVFNTEDIKAPATDTLHQDMSVPHVESSRKSDEVEMEVMNEINGTNPDAQQEDGQGIALQDLLAKEKVEKKKEPIGASDASVSMGSDTNLKPKTKSFWAHCICCSTVH